MKHFEDFHVGDEEALPGKAVFTRKSIIEFATEFDPQPHHLDEDAAAKSILGALSAPGWQTTCAVNRVLAEYQNYHVAYEGNLGVEETRWRKPLFPGDELTLTSEITETKGIDDDPTIGLVKRVIIGVKQDGTVAITMRGWIKVRRRAVGEAP